MYKRAMIVMIWVLLAGCSSDPAPREAPLTVLTTDSAALDGRLVATEGVVRHFEAPLHYWIEDAELNRVALSPHEAVAPYLGERVRVVGEFSFSQGRGRHIDVDSIAALSD